MLIDVAPRHVNFTWVAKMVPSLSLYGPAKVGRFSTFEDFFYNPANPGKDSIRPHIIFIKMPKVLGHGLYTHLNFDDIPFLRV